MRKLSWYGSVRSGTRAWPLAAALLAVACLAPWTAHAAPAEGQWNALGSRLNATTSCCTQAVLRMDAAGNPTVAWVEGPSSANRLLVASWNGSAWVALGSALASGSIVLGNSSLALDANGLPVVAWTNGATGYVSRWNGSAWSALGGPFAGVMGGQLAVVSADPLVVSLFGQTTRSLTLETWDGASWTASAPHALSGYTVAFPLSETVDGQGNPIVAWRGLRATGGSGDFDLVVEQWSGGSWVRLGGVLNVVASWGVADAQIRAVGGTITVAWGEMFYRQPRMTYVKQWSGGAWLQLGGAVDSNGQGAVTLALDAGGAPAVGVIDGTQLLVKTWDGSAWQTLAGSVNVPAGTTPVDAPSLDVGANIAAIAWIGAQSTDSSPLAYGVYVSRLEVGGAPPPPPPPPRHPRHPRRLRRLRRRT